MTIRTTKTLNELPVLDSRVLDQALLMVMQDNKTYQIRADLLRNGVWLPPPGTPTQNVDNFLAAIAKAKRNGKGETIYIPPLDYTLNSYLPVDDVAGINIVGFGHQSHLISTYTHAYNCLFELGDVRESSFRNFRVSHNANLFGTFGSRNKAGGLASTHLQFENIHIAGGDKIDVGYHIGSHVNEPDALDANNDFNVFYRCYLTGYKDSGAMLRGEYLSSQAYSNQFEQCLFYGGTGAKYAINAGGNYPGNFSWNNGFVGLHTLSDFLIGRSYQPFKIAGVHSENSAMFLDVDALDCMVRAIDNRYAANSIRADGTAIKIRGRVTAIFELNRLGDGGRLVSGENIPFQIDIEESDQIDVSFRQNLVYSVNDNVFSNAVPGDMWGNKRVAIEANSVRVPL